MWAVIPAHRIQRNGDVHQADIPRDLISGVPGRRGVCPRGS
jgi:hypothetical protein